MNITRDMRLKAAETATPDQLWLYGSEEAAERLYDILLKHKVTDSRQKGQCATIVSNVVLGFHKASELPDLLGAVVTLPFRDTLSLTADLLDYLELKAPGTPLTSSASLSEVPRPIPPASPQVAPPTTPSTPVSPQATVPLTSIPLASPIPPPLRPLTDRTADLKTDIAEAEAALEALEPLRTMAHDMETLKSIPPPTAATEPPIYSSSQNALIHEAEHARIRPGNPADGPSWTTDKNG